MQTKVTIHYRGVSSTSSTIFNLDEFCPHCGKPGTPRVSYAIASDLFENESNSVGILIQCPREECKKFHIQEFPFEKSNSTSNMIIRVGSKITYTYKVKMDNTLPSLVNDTFPNFKKIYDQSLEAESQGLDEISGIGFRKSIEFLIKEYVIHKNPERTEEVKSKFLGKIIDDNLKEFPKIQTLAKAAVWIGNDETHFVRVHQDKDIQDMKEFLVATALFISAELAVEEAIDFTNRPKH